MQGLADFSDYDLVRKSCEGTVEAFAILVKRYQKPLIALCMRYSDDVHQAEDIVQESFLKAFEKLASFQFRSAFKSWIYRIAINTAKNRLRAKKPTVAVDKVVLKIPPKGETGLIDYEIKTIVKEFIETLPEKQKMALKLRVYDELSFKQVAEIMDCPYDTAKANYRHGMLKIRQMVTAEAI